MAYQILVWNNYGERTEHRAATLSAAEDMARESRNQKNRTVKIAHTGDAIRHWTRTEGAHGNQWSYNSLSNDYAYTAAREHAKSAACHSPSTSK
jgi:hypothetical protein